MYLVQRVEGGLCIRTNVLSEAELLAICPSPSSAAESSSASVPSAVRETIANTSTLEDVRKQLATKVKNLWRTIENSSFSADKEERLRTLTSVVDDLDRQIIEMTSRPKNVRFRKQ